MSKPLTNRPGKNAKDPLLLKENEFLFKKQELRGRYLQGETIPKDQLKKLALDIPGEEELFGDFRTYCEELLWIRDKRGNVVPFFWNPVQVRLNAQMEAERDKGRRHFLILKYRRPGITTLMQARSFWLVANKTNQYAVTLAHDAQSTQKIFDISLLYYSRLPDWGRPHRKTESRKELNFNKMNSVFYIGTAGGEAFGRGQTLQRVHASEVAFWPKSTDVGNLVAGLAEATSHGELAIESTANGIGNWFHKNWFAAKNGENIYVPIFLSWKDDPELQYPTSKALEDMRLTTEEETIAKAYSLSPGQILWRRLKMKELYDPDKGDSLFRQEYPINDVEAFISSGSCFFDAETIARIVNLCKKPISTADAGRLKIYEEPKAYREYAIGADIGEGVAGGRRTAIACIDTKTCEEVANWVGICSPEAAAQKMADMGALYHTAILAPEANNFGHSTINTLLNQIHYPHLYESIDYQRLMDVDSDPASKYGWATNAKTRPILLSEFRHALQTGLYHANDPELFAECLAFVDNGHGKYEASAGAFDDRIFAHAIAFQARHRQIELTDFSKFAVDTGYVSIDAQWEEF